MALGKITYWNPNIGIGTLIDREGKEFPILQDMFEPMEDSLLASLKEGLIVHFEFNPSLGGNERMSISWASQDEEFPSKPLKEEIEDEIPFELQDETKALLKHKDHLNDQKLKEIAESMTDSYPMHLFKWYEEDLGRFEYADYALKENKSDSVREALEQGQYYYYCAKLEEARRLLIQQGLIS